MLLTETLTKKGLEIVIQDSFSNFGNITSSFLLESLKFLGFYYSTTSGLSITIDDLKTPEEKTQILEETESVLNQVSQEWQQAMVSDNERFQRILSSWDDATETLKNHITEYYKKFDPMNSLYIMAFSGARGNMSQVRQLIGMRGLMADQAGKIISLPIQANFREGLSSIDYIVSSYGSRKGIVDTALKTADSGYLTRRLVYVARNIVIKSIDCKTKKGILIDLNLTTPFQPLLGKTLISYHFFNEVNGNFSLNGKILTEKLLKKLLIKREIFLQKKFLNIFFKNNFFIKIRSPLICALPFSICQKCYGWDLGKQSMIGLGEAVGIIAGQSIGEPGTQLTMRTFHTGGIFTSQVIELIRTPFSGKIFFPKNFQAIPIRTLDGKNILKVKTNTSFDICDWKGNAKKIFIRKGCYLYVSSSKFVKKDQVIAESPKQQLSKTFAKKTSVYSLLEGQIRHEKTVFIPSKVSDSDYFDFDLDFDRANIFWIFSGKIYELPKKASYLYPTFLTKKQAFAKLKLITPYQGIIRRNENFIYLHTAHNSEKILKHNSEKILKKEVSPTYSELELYLFYTKLFENFIFSFEDFFCPIDDYIDELNEFIAEENEDEEDEDEDEEDEDEDEEDEDEDDEDEDENEDNINYEDEEPYEDDENQNYPEYTESNPDYTESIDEAIIKVAMGDRLSHKILLASSYTDGQPSGTTDETLNTLKKLDEPMVFVKKSIPLYYPDNYFTVDRDRARAELETLYYPYQVLFNMEIEAPEIIPESYERIKNYKEIEEKDSVFDANKFYKFFQKNEGLIRLEKYFETFMSMLDKNLKLQLYKKKKQPIIARVPIELFSKVTHNTLQKLHFLGKNYQYFDPFSLLGILYFYPLFEGKILGCKCRKFETIKKKNKYFFLTESDTWKISTDQFSQYFFSKSRKGKKILHRGKRLTATIQSLKSGFLLKKDGFRFLFQDAFPIFLPEGTKINYKDGDFLKKNAFLAKLTNYTQQSQDIVQGLPKIEEILEARLSKENPFEYLKTGLILDNYDIKFFRFKKKNNQKPYNSFSSQLSLVKLKENYNELRKSYNDLYGNEDDNEDDITKAFIGSIYGKLNSFLLNRKILSLKERILTTKEKEELIVKFKKGYIYFYTQKGNLKRKKIRYGILIIQEKKKKKKKINKEITIIELFHPLKKLKYFEAVFQNTFIKNPPQHILSGGFLSFDETFGSEKVNLQSFLKELTSYTQNWFGYKIGTVKATEKFQLVLLNAIQGVYSSQGVSISNKHLEIILRQMLRKVKIENRKDLPVNMTLKEPWIPEAEHDLLIITKLVEILESSSSCLPIYYPVYKSITRIACNEDGFLSRAGFQETKKMLQEAALFGPSNWLKGLKDTIIVGKRINAGSTFLTEPFYVDLATKLINKEKKKLLEPLESPENLEKIIEEKIKKFIEFKAQNSETLEKKEIKEFSIEKILFKNGFLNENET